MKISTGILMQLLFLTAGQIGFAFADGADAQKEWSHRPAEAQGPTNTASDASFDKRLPPVLPGEEVNDSGKKMKVWSTSGPVPVSQAPQPFDDPKPDVSSNLGVIVDQRACEGGGCIGARRNK